ncbi:HMG box domain-containing protein [Mycena chlorophos]|uniref:HMG box domain-containing protein n=1 Tax=Mycena chlorophos TaxID=658473 RepID=A0A8H6SPV4_MYCCL|nr:HMG box domain-containing protein [Mycena chlorophos]
MPVARRSTPYPRPREEESPSLSGSNYSPTPTPTPQTTITTPEPTSEAADAFLGSQIVLPSLPSLPVLAPPITLKIPAARTKPTGKPRARKPSSKPTGTAGSRGRGSSKNTTLFRLDDAGKYSRVPKPRNAFFVFRAEYLQRLSPSADKSRREPRYVGDRWKALSADARVPYQVKAASEAAEYRAFLDQWADDGASGESNASVGQPAGIVIPDEVLTAPTRTRKGRGRPKKEIQDGAGTAEDHCMSVDATSKSETADDSDSDLVTVQVKLEDVDIDLASLEVPAVVDDSREQLADASVPVEPELSELSPLPSTPVLVQNELDAAVTEVRPWFLLQPGKLGCNASFFKFGRIPEPDSDPWVGDYTAALPELTGTGILMQSGSPSSICYPCAAHEDRDAYDAFHSESIAAGLDERCGLREGWWAAKDGFPMLPSVGDILDSEATNAK